LAKKGFFKTLKAFSFAGAVLAAGLFASSLAGCSNMGDSASFYDGQNYSSDGTAVGLGAGQSSAQVSDCLTARVSLPSLPTLSGNAPVPKNIANNISKSAFPDIKDAKPADNYSFEATLESSGGTVYEAVGRYTPSTAICDFAFAGAKNASLQTYTLTVKLYHTDISASPAVKSLVARGNQSVTVAADASSFDSSVSLAPNLGTATDPAPNGSLELPIKFSDTSVTSVQLKLLDSGDNDKTTDYLDGLSGTDLPLSSGEGTIQSKASGLPAGTYTLLMTFMKGSAQVGFRTESLNVYPTMQTKLWWTKDGIGTATTTLHVTQFNQKEFWVRGTGGDFYSTVFPTAAEAEDTNNGSFAFPLKTIQEAVDRINTIGNTTTQYTIYIDGKVTVPADADYSTISDDYKKSLAYIDSAQKIAITGWTGSGVDIIDCGKKCRAITAASGAEVAITKLAIKNGDAVNYGGALYVGGGDSTVVLGDGALVNGNHCETNGGAIYCNGNLYICGSAVVGDYSPSMTAALEDDCGNSCDGSGGGISCSGNLYLGYSGKNSSGGLIEKALSGGIYRNYSKTYGGGIYSTGTVTMASGSVDFNAATSGGGVYVSGSSTSSGKFYMGGTSRISGNEATGAGGGVYNSEYGIFCMAGSAIVGADPSGLTEAAKVDNGKHSNMAKYGGGILIGKPSGFKFGYKNETTSDPTFSGGVYYNYSTDDGGGIRVNCPTGTGQIFNFERGSVCYNSSGLVGGGITVLSVTSNPKIYITGGQVSNNSAGTDGGGIHAQNVYVGGGTIAGNTASNYGGGVYASQEFYLYGTGVIGDDGTHEVAEADDCSNKAKAGGGVYSHKVYIGYSDASTPAACTGGIYRNYATSNGGGIYSSSAVTMEKGSVCYNGAHTSAGGIYGSAGVSIGGGKIAKNEAGAYGGGVYCQGDFFLYGDGVIGDDQTASPALADDCSNKAMFGGGVYVRGSAYIGYSAADTPSACTGGIYRNYATNDGSALTGGGLWLERPTSATAMNFKMASGTFAYNAVKSTIQLGGGLVLNGHSYVVAGETQEITGGSFIKNVAGKGGAVYFDAYSGLGVGGGVSAPSATGKQGDNDIYLTPASANYLRLVSNFSAEAPVLTITPPAYTAGQRVFENNSYLADNREKVIIADNGDDIAWSVVSDGTLKKAGAIYVAAESAGGSDDDGDGSADHPYATLRRAAQAFTDKAPSTGDSKTNPKFDNKIYVISDLTYRAGAGLLGTDAYNVEIVGRMNDVAGDKVKLIFNTPDETQCGFYVPKNHKIKFNNIDITQTDTDTPNAYAVINVDADNTSPSSIYGECWLMDCTIKGMYANKCSAIEANGAVYLNNVEISGNKTQPDTSGDKAFGPAVNCNKGTVKIFGKVVIQDNMMKISGASGTGEREQNLWIGGDAFNPLQLLDAIDDSKIGVTLTNNGNKFTAYYKNYEGATDPATFFKSDEGWSVVLAGDTSGNAMLQAPTTLHVAAAGNDIFGTGTVSKPFATIQAAVDAINNVIKVATGNYTIKVDDSLTAAQHAAVDNTLKAASLKIQGESAAASIVSGVNADSLPILWISNISVPVTIEKIGFTSGVNTATEAGGGAILAENCSDVTITDCGFVSCSANDASGGAIYMDGGSISMSGVSFTSNTAKNGGAIYVKSGTLEMPDGLISLNTATSSGGGVYVASDGTFIMSGGTISSNSAGINGGGICNEGTTCIYGDATIGELGASGTAESATACSNKADYNGGGIYNGKKLALGYKAWASTATAPAAADKETLNNGVYYNYAQTGGGIFNSNTGTVYIASGKVSKNLAFSATEGGGGICNYDTGAKLYVTDGTIDYNKAYTGAGVYIHSSTFDLNGGTIDHNTATYDAGGVGMNGTSGSFTFESGKITNNTATNDAGGVGLQSGTFTMNDGEISGNSATHSSGGVGVSGGSFTLNGGTIKSNETSENSGGVGIGSGVTFEMTGGSIEGNTALGKGGGVGNSGTFKMSGGTIYGNTAVQGGGISTSGITLIYNTAQIGAEDKANTATSDVDTDTAIGGAILVQNSGKLGLGYSDYSSSTFTVAEWTGSISYNTARDGGGGVFNRGLMAMKYGTIDHNTAPMGAGVYTTNTTGFTLNGGTISNNEASASAGGGGGVCAAGTFVMANGTISGNIGKFGGGIWNYRGNTSIIGGTITANKAELGAGLCVYTDDYTASAVTSSMSGGSITANIGTIYTGTASFGGGVYIGEHCKFTMSGGTNSANTAVYGGGVYINKKTDGATVYVGEFNISGNATIPAGTGKTNIVQLVDKMTISGNITSTGTDPVATIKPLSYGIGTQVLDGTTARLNSYHDRFAVVDDSSGNHWTIDQNGLLSKDVSGGGSISIDTPEGKLTLSSNVTEITTNTNTQVTITGTTTPSGGTLSNWSIDVYYGTDLIGSSSNNKFTIASSYPNGTYSLVVSVTYNSVTYSDTLTVTKNVP